MPIIATHELVEGQVTAASQQIYNALCAVRLTKRYVALVSPEDYPRIIDEPGKPRINVGYAKTEELAKIKLEKAKNARSSDT